MRHSKPAPSGPFSRLMSVDELSGLPGNTIVITAKPEECKALAEINKIVGIEKLEATFKVAPGKRDIHLTGEVRAKITQTCVVTLEPFEASMAEAIDIRFAPATPPAPAGKGKHAPRVADLGDEPMEDDPPEPLIDGHIDLGAVAAEFFALGLDPYPRKPGLEVGEEPLVFGDKDDEPETGAEDNSENPFAALAKLRTQDPGKAG